MEIKFMAAMSNETLYNRTFFKCGVPPADSLHIFRDAVTGDIPWTGALLGLSTLGLYTWDQDQVFYNKHKKVNKDAFFTSTIERLFYGIHVYSASVLLYICQHLVGQVHHV